VGELCLTRESVIRVALVVLLLACKIVFACERGVVSAGAACDLGGSALPADKGVHGDAAPANGVHGDAAPADSSVHWDAAPTLGGRLGRSAPVIGPVGRVVGAAAPFGGPCLAAGPPATRVVVVRVILDEDFGLGVAILLTPCLPLTAANAFFRSRRSRDDSFSSCAFLRGLGVPPASSGSCTLPSNLAERGGFRRPKLFETFGVSRPPGAFLPCFIPANVVTATVPAALPSAEESIQRIWSNGLMLGGVVGAMMFFTRFGLLHEGFWAKK
jgi:hypothetical protein